MTIYRWKVGSERKGGDVQAIGQILSDLVQQHGDRLKPSVIVDAARPETSPLHSQFTWDDVKAADLYRRQEARMVMNSIRVVVDEDSEPQPMFISVIETVFDEPDRAYVTTARAMRDAELTAQILQQARRDIASFRQRYGHLKELAEVADYADASLVALAKESTTAA